MSQPGDRELQHFSFGRLDRMGGMASAADPDVLARAVRDHKVGDAMTQAALTLALMLAIGVVAFVLSVGRAAAAAGALLADGVIDPTFVLAALALAGGTLLVGRHAALRRAMARVRRHRAR